MIRLQTCGSCAARRRTNQKVKVYLLKKKKPLTHTNDDSFCSKSQKRTKKSNLQMETNAQIPMISHPPIKKIITTIRLLLLHHHHQIVPIIVSRKSPKSCDNKSKPAQLLLLLLSILSRQPKKMSTSSDHYLKTTPNNNLASPAAAAAAAAAVETELVNPLQKATIEQSFPAAEPPLPKYVDVCFIHFFLLI